MPSLLSILLIIIAVYFIFIQPGQRKRHQAGRNSGGRYARWIGGGLGWALGGPIGGLLGFAIGSLAEKPQTESGPTITRPADFKLSLMVLTAAIMKADGTVKKSELNYVRAFLINQFGHAEAGDLLIVLRDLLKKEINIQAVANQIGMMMDPAAKQQLLYYLFGISTADGELTMTESSVLKNIAHYMGIPESEFRAMLSMFVKKLYNPYEILEISQEATDEEVKKAYRQAALKYHPDRVSHLGEDVKKDAEEKFKKVAEAYETIKKQRGIA
ncbi:MAG TPA: TerB family tellurite resistance protein [Bacteroidales bacterium]|nr:TerB family tellurite resistance protein [Bacteroidales bacterium]